MDTRRPRWTDGWGAEGTAKAPSTRCVTAAGPPRSKPAATPTPGAARYAAQRRRTKPEALKALDELRRRVGAGVALQRTLTVAGYLDRWVDGVLPPAGVAQSTVDKYRWVVDHWLRPHRHREVGPSDAGACARRLRQLDKAG